MRLHLQLTPNTQPVPFEYLHYLTGAFHKWIGPNDLHDGLSLYSLSWLHGSRFNRRENALSFPEGARWSLSSHDDTLLEAVVAGIARDAEVCCGMSVMEVQAQCTPEFGERFVFRADSPVLARGQEIEGKVKHYLFSDPEADAVLTQTLRHKLDKAGLPAQNAVARFDRSYRGAKTKLLRINGIANVASLCPVIVEGTPEAVQFAWNTGAGHLTGSGFGCLA